jgi:hypothetical protein
MTDKKYNGWTNYETWCVGLWIDNDQAMQETWNDRAQYIVDRYDRKHDKDSYSDAACKLAEELKDEFEQNSPGLEGFWSDLLNSALSEVEWREVAESLCDSVETEEEDGVAA